MMGRNQTILILFTVFEGDSKLRMGIYKMQTWSTTCVENLVRYGALSTSN